MIKGLTFSFLIASAVENLAHASTVIVRLSLLPGSLLNHLLTLLDHALRDIVYKFKNEVIFCSTVPDSANWLPHLVTRFFWTWSAIFGPRFFTFLEIDATARFFTLWWQRCSAVGDLYEVSWYISERCSAIRPSLGGDCQMLRSWEPETPQTEACQTTLSQRRIVGDHGTRRAGMHTALPGNTSTMTSYWMFALSLQSRWW